MEIVMMKPYTQKFNTIKQMHRIDTQKGLVLFLALIALVAMSLAAVALIRSVDTNAQIAGNLSFKQTATISADNGIESAINWVNANPTLLDSNSAANGYYAKSDGTGLSNAVITKEANWVDTYSAKAAGFGISTAGIDNSGNTIRYIIERMSNAAAAPTEENSLFGIGFSKTGSSSVQSAPQQGAVIAAGLSPVYRVTARVTGPKNTISYVQAYIY